MIVPPLDGATASSTYIALIRPLLLGACCSGEEDGISISKNLLGNAI